MSDPVADFLSRAESTEWAVGEAPALAGVVRRGAAIRRRRRTGALAAGLAVVLVGGGVTAVLSGGARSSLLVPDRATASRTVQQAPTPSDQGVPTAVATDGGTPPLPSPVPDPSGVPAEGFPAAADFGPDWVVGREQGDNRLTATLEELGVPVCPGTATTPIRAQQRSQIYRHTGSQQYTDGQAGTQWLLDVRVADLSATQLTAIRQAFANTVGCDPAEGSRHVVVARTETLLVTAQPSGDGYTYAKGWALAGDRFVFLDFLPDIVSPAEVPPQWMVEATRTVAFRAGGTLPAPITASTPPAAGSASSTPSSSAPPPTGNPVQVHTPTPAPKGFLSEKDLAVAGVTGWEVGNVVGDYGDQRSTLQLAQCGGSPLDVDGRTRLQSYRSSLGEDPNGPHGELFGTQTVVDVTPVQEKAVRTALAGQTRCRVGSGPWVVEQRGTPASGYVELVGTALVDHHLVVVSMTVSARTPDGAPKQAELPGGRPWFEKVLDAAAVRLAALPA